ncbi:MAG: enoyl-CoA hydratase-related protein [Paracoccaceae bacterium]
MEYKTIKYSVTDGVATIMMDRASVMNALNTQMRAEIAHAAQAAGTEARVLVITGDGRAFCSGQDLSDRANASNMDMERTLRDEYGPMIRAIYDCPIPTISAVNGAAAGAGANLALAADIVIASESAYFMQAFARIGLIPDAGGTYWMTRSMGMAKAMGAALFADKVTARQADDWGLIWEAVPDAEFAAVWQARAQQLASGPTAAYQGIKTSIRSAFNNTIEQQLDLEGKLQGACGKTRDFQEGVVAFLEKRPAKFEGR